MADENPILNERRLTRIEEKQEAILNRLEELVARQKEQNGRVFKNADNIAGLAQAVHQHVVESDSHKVFQRLDEHDAEILELQKDKFEREVSANIRGKDIAILGGVGSAIGGVGFVLITLVFPNLLR